MRIKSSRRGFWLAIGIVITGAAILAAHNGPPAATGPITAAWESLMASCRISKDDEHTYAIGAAQAYPNDVAAQVNSIYAGVTAQCRKAGIDPCFSGCKTAKTYAGGPSTTTLAPVATEAAPAQPANFYDPALGWQTRQSAVVCASYFRVEDGVKAAAAGDEKWLAETGCVIALGGLRLIPINAPYPETKYPGCGEDTERRVRIYTRPLSVAGSSRFRSCMGFLNCHAAGGTITA